jgi:hypothetical protein
MLKFESFQLIYTPATNKSTSCKDIRQINYKDEQRVLLRVAMKYGGVLWLEN